MPGNSRPRLAAIRSSRATNTASSPLEPQEAPEQLLRHLHPRKSLGALLGVAEDHREAEREVRGIGERPPQSDQKGRQGGKDPALEQARQLLALLALGGGGVDEPDPMLRQRGNELGGEAARGAVALLGDDFGDRVDLLVGRQAVGATPGAARLDVVVERRQPDHEDLVQVRLPDRAELDPFEQGNRGVLGELEDAVVEVEPGELAVEVERRVLEVGLVIHPGTVCARGYGGLVDRARDCLRRDRFHRFLVVHASSGAELR